MGKSAQPDTSVPICTRAASGGRQNAEPKHVAVDARLTRPVSSPESTSALVRASPRPAGTNLDLLGVVPMDSEVSRPGQVLYARKPWRSASRHEPPVANVVGKRTGSAGGLLPSPHRTGKGELPPDPGRAGAGSTARTVQTAGCCDAGPTALARLSTMAPACGRPGSPLTFVNRDQISPTRCSSLTDDRLQ